MTRGIGRVRGRPPLPPGDKRGVRVHACLTMAEVEAIDATRGALTRGQWLAELVRIVQRVDQSGAMP